MTVWAQLFEKGGCRYPLDKFLSSGLCNCFHYYQIDDLHCDLLYRDLGPVFVEVGDLR